MTVAWNVGEAAAALTLGWLAGSIALVGFGLDSVIETVSAGVLYARLRGELRGEDAERGEARERKALRFVGVTFFVLAAYVTFESIATLWMRRPPERSVGGLVVAALSMVVMPVLGWAKLKVGRTIGSKALVADAKETFSCAVLSGTVLIGVGMNALMGWWWADPLAALVLVPFLIREGREALAEARGEENCHACDDAHE